MDLGRQTRVELARHLPVFDGYPYLVTALVGGLYHFIVLPGDLGTAELLSLARRQHSANRLRTCLAIGADDALYVSDEGETVAEVPRCSDPISDRLLGPEEFPVTAELRDRQQRLRGFIADSQARSAGGYLVDRMRGRTATAEDLVRLSGTDPHGVPVGLVRCAVCAAYRGSASRRVTSRAWSSGCSAGARTTTAARGASTPCTSSGSRPPITTSAG